MDMFAPVADFEVQSAKRLLGSMRKAEALVVKTWGNAWASVYRFTSLCLGGFYFGALQDLSGPSRKNRYLQR